MEEPKPSKPAIAALSFNQVGGHVETRRQINGKRHHVSWATASELERDLDAFLRLKSSGTSLPDLANRLAAGDESSELTNLGSEGVIEFKAFCEKVFEPHRKNKAGWEWESKRMEQILREGVFCGKHIHSIRTKAIQDWYDAYSSRAGVNSDNTRANMLKVMRAIFRVATRLNYIKNNPAIEIRAPGVPDSDKKAYSLPQAVRLYAAAKEIVRIWILLTLYMGLRPCEIMRLCVSDVDLSRRCISVRGNTHKNRSRDLYIHDALWPYIQIAASSVPNLPLIRGEKGEASPFPRAAFEQARKKAGLQDFTFYELRDTFDTWLYENGTKDYELRAYLMGHRRRGMTARYNHAHFFPLGKEAISRLPSVIGAPEVDKQVDNGEGGEKCVI